MLQLIFHFFQNHWQGNRAQKKQAIENVLTLKKITFKYYDSYIGSIYMPVSWQSSHWLSYSKSNYLAPWIRIHLSLVLFAQKDLFELFHLYTNTHDWAPFLLAYHYIYHNIPDKSLSHWFQILWIDFKIKLLSCFLRLLQSTGAFSWLDGFLPIEYEFLIPHPPLQLGVYKGKKIGIFNLGLLGGGESLSPCRNSSSVSFSHSETFEPFGILCKSMAKSHRM